MIKTLVKRLKEMMKNEDGYEIVELLLIVAGLGLLTTGVFVALNDSILGNDKEGGKSAIGQVTGGISTMLDGWFTDGLGK